MEIWLSLLWVLVCVVLIIGLAYWFTRYIALHGGLGGLGPATGTEQFKILAQLPLGRDQRLALVQAGERYFLLGITASSVANLAEFTREEAEAWCAQQQPAPAPSFGEALKTVLRQKKR